MSGSRFASRPGDLQAGRRRPKSRPGALARIERLESRELLTTFTVTTSSDAGGGSLRAAINAANLAGGADVINFQIAGTGVHTINLGTSLPAITDEVTIDGTTQTGFSDHPVIELNGSAAGVGTNGLTLQANNVLVKALAIKNFSGRGIVINSSLDTIQLCFLGTDATGTSAEPNGGSGIELNNSSNNQIGGYQNGLSLGNLLSGNTGAGIQITGAGSTFNRIIGNFIGTSSSGGKGTGNSGDGILISGGSNNQIGGLTPGSANVISGNKNNGITILGSTSQNNTIFGNFIGTDGNPTGGAGGVPAGGNVAIGNGQAGIDIQQGASRTFIGSTSDNTGNIISGNGAAGILVENGPATTIQNNIIGADATGSKNIGNGGAGVAIITGDGTVIGGTLAGASNVIAFNGGKLSAQGGVSIQSAQNVPILSNSIFSNFGKGIILSAGANNNQVFPVITQAATAAGRTLIKGTLDSAANSTYLLQFFTNSSPGPGRFGQGQTLLGQTQVTTDAAGHADISVTFGMPSNINYFVSATATDAAGNTSEFSLDAQVVKANQANLTLGMTASPTPGTLGADLVYSITVTNTGPDAATNVQFDQVLPVGLNFKGSSGPTGVTITQTSTGVHASIGSIAAGAQVTFTITVTSNITGTLTSTGSVTSSEIDPNPSDNTVTVSTRIDIPVDLGVTLASTTPSVTVGQNLSIIATVMNAGPGAASGAVLQVRLPSNVSFVSASSGQNSATFANGVVTAKLGVLTAGTPIAVSIIVTAPINVPTTGDLTFSATVTADQFDPKPSDNTATLAVPVDPSTDLALTLVANPTSALSGQNVTYTYTIVNNGLSPATSVRLVDTVPTGVNFIAAPPPSQGSTSFATDSKGVVTITANLGNLAPGASATGTIVLEKDTTGRIDNTATVTALEPDPDTTNNSVTIDTLVDPVDVSASVQASPDPVAVGKNLTYTIFVTNTGPASATGVLAIDTLPAGVTFISATSGQGTVSESGGVVTANLNTLTAGVTVPVTIVVVPTASGQLLNSVVVSSNQTETDPGNNTISTTTYVNPADIGVQLSVSPAFPLPGDPITYTAFVTNNSGTFTGTNVTLSDSLPAGLQLVSATSSQGTVSTAGNAIQALIGSLVPGASATITIIARALTSGSFDNTVTAASDQVDPDLTNNSAVATVNVTNGPGVFQFATTTFSFGENAVEAMITVTRTSGNLGAVSVNYATSNGTGVAGTNYLTTSGTLFFNNGELSKSFLVPVLDDGVVNGATTVNLSLSSPAGGATLAANAAATLIIAETDFDLTGPTLSSIRPVGTGKSVTGVVLSFSEALDPARATNPNNYALFAPSKGGGFTQVGLLTPTYDSTAHTVTLTSTRPLALNIFYRLGINGSSATGVADIFDNLLQGNGSGNGQDFVATFARGSALKYVDHNGDTVTLNISNGGLIDLTRSASGEGQVLTVLGAGSKRSLLTGNVRRGGFNSDGVTTFQSIVGANFGRVDSRLTTPKFFVDQVTAFIKGSTASVKAASVSIASVHPKSAHKLFTKSLVRKLAH